MSTTRQPANDRLPYSIHVEPAEQGGATYEKCLDCGRECITAMGGFDGLLHAEDCRHRDR